MTLRETVKNGVMNIYQAYLQEMAERERLEYILEKQSKDLDWYMRDHKGKPGKIATVKALYKAGKSLDFIAENVKLPVYEIYKIMRGDYE